MNGVGILDKDYAEDQLLKWSSAVESLFPQGVPYQEEWTEMDEIRKVLKHMTASPAANHTFLNSGGMDFDSIGTTFEKDAITIIMSGARLVIKPKRLTFYNLLDGDPNWLFFYIELDKLNPIGSYDGDRTSEEVVWLSPGEYIPREHWDRDSYNGRSLPSSAKLVRREWGGNYVMFSKGSRYNRGSGGYDGRHSKMGRDAFKDFLVRGLSK